MAQITEQGIQGKSLNEYLSEINAGQLAIDPEWNIDPDSPDGQRNGIDAELFANLDEAVVQAYNSKDPDRATGEALNDIGKISGVPRMGATSSVAPIAVSGPAGTVIPANSQVRSSVDNSLWLATADIVIGGGGTATGFVLAAVPGRVLAEIGTLTVIGTPIAGWASVTNTATASPGRPAESDTDFRIRRDLSVALAGSNQVDNMYAAVANVEDVSDVKVYENDTGATNALGIPSHSIAVVVNGGLDADIAWAMYTKKNPGVRMYPEWNPDTETWVTTPVLAGYVQQDVTSPVTGNVASITFQRAIALPIYGAIVVKQIGNLPSDIEDEIAQAIVEDSTRTLFAEDIVVGFNRRGYDIGEIVPPGRLFTPVNKVLGKYGDSYVVSINIGTAPTPLSGTAIQPAYNQLASFNPANFAVTLT